MQMPEFLFRGSSMENENDLYYFTNEKSDDPEDPSNLKLWTLDMYKNQSHNSQDQSKGPDLETFTCVGDLQDDLLRVLGIESDVHVYLPSIICWPEIHKEHIVIKGLGQKIARNIDGLAHELDYSLTNLHIYNFKRLQKPSYIK